LALDDRNALAEVGGLSCRFFASRARAYHYHVKTVFHCRLECSEIQRCGRSQASISTLPPGAQRRRKCRPGLSGLFGQRTALCRPRTATTALRNLIVYPIRQAPEGSVFAAKSDLPVKPDQARSV
jgi:hypothetical protein